MQNQQQGDRLSWGDTVFLHLEREGMPLNVACVCIFEGEVAFKDLIHSIESKLPLLPRYLKRVVAPPFNVGLPTWEYDPSFDIRNHVHELTLTRGTDAELKSVAGKLLSKVMNRQHPLWDLTLVHGLTDNRAAVIIRLHHCLADGIAGVGIVKVLLDQSPVTPRLPRKKLRLEVPPPRDPLTSLVGSVVDSYSDFVKRTLSALADLLSMAERASANGESLPADELSRLLPEVAAFTDRLRFNVPYRGPQKFAWGEIPLAQVKAIRLACGTSINDVVLALVTATIRRYAEVHGDRVKGRLLRMMVPVNLRGSDSSEGELGNRISLVPVTIPLDIRNSRKLLAAVHKRSEFVKHAHTAELVSLAGGLIGMFPTSLQAMVGPLLSRLPITPFNLVCTNVPGPQVPLYLLGRKMLSFYPYVPIGGEMAMNCAVLSYDGKMFFGFSGDVHAAPDLRRLEKLLQASFEELREAARIGPPSKKKGRKHAKVQVERQGKPLPVEAVPIPIKVAAPAPSTTSAKNPTTEGDKVLTQLIA
jgi:diacylglycerol O-acyltransferase / wax synthase